ncbi:zinc finger protein 391-like [Toxorhynchites rutilus septentrionalis]|uniref:zinc finger protein 391-like n=1 Tax=Toxorhynchites rutilus septentrionalis TaxID=329112 RepID=UPI002478ECC8|nr:zinc finger protein 391-like [Toxorhynchites rutilus septentrionalis]
MNNPMFEMDKICRLCLQNIQTGSLVNLFAANFSIRPLDMISRCASVEIYEKDGLPAAICNDCFYKLGMAYEFRNRCEVSDKKLREYIQLSDGPSRDENHVEIVKEDEIYAAMSELFGQDVGPNSKEEEFGDAKASEEIIDISDTMEKCPKITKDTQFTKKRALLDELLVKHKAKMKQEKPVVNIFKPRRVRRKAAAGQSKKGTFLKVPEQCFTCGKTFNYSGYLLAHQRIHSGEKPYECQICQRRFAQSGNLKLHLRIHDDERKYQCEVCSKLFKTSSNLHAHKKTHSEERNFPCTLCDRAFRTSQELRSHSDTHSAVKSYVCQLCDNKAFHKQSYLNSHIKTVHIGVKRHRCQDCGKIFSNSSNLIAHRRVHNGDRPYACDECDAKFTQSPALLRHIKAKHRSKPEKSTVAEVTDEPIEPSIDIDENRSLDSAVSSELSVATSLIDNPSSFNETYMPSYVPTHSQATMPQTQMAPGHACNLYPGELFQYQTNSTHHYQQQHMDMGSYDMSYTMSTHSVLNPSLMNPQPTYIFDQ